MSVSAADLERWRESILRTTESMIASAIANIRQTRVVNVPIVVGVGGAPLAVGNHAFLRLGLNGAATIIQWSIAATVGGVPTAGTCVLDVLEGSTLASAASICSSNRPALTAQAERSDQSPTGWIVTMADPSWLIVRVVSTDGALEVVGLTLRMIIGIDVGAAVVGSTASDVFIVSSGDTLVYGG